MVTGKKECKYYFFIYLWLSVLFASTKDTAELNVKHVKHNVITTKSIKIVLANLCTCIRAFHPRYHGYYWAALSLSFRLISILLMNIIAWCPQVTMVTTQESLSAGSYLRK